MKIAFDIVQRAAVAMACLYESEQPEYDAKYHRENAEKILLAAFGIEPPVPPPWE